MRWRLMLSVLTWGAIVSAAGWGNGLGTCPAQQPPAQPGETQQLAGEAGPSLLHESQAAKFRMILGRLSLEPPQHIKCTRVQESPDGLVKESLRVTACRGIPSLHYHWATPLRTVSVDVNLATHVKFHSTISVQQVPTTLIVDQPPEGDISFRIESLGKDGKIVVEEHFSSPSLVHFRAQYPREYQLHLAPLLNQLLVQPHAECGADDLLQIAVQQRNQSPAHDPQQIEALVEQLRAPSRQRRAEADQRLRAIGLPVLAIIARIDTSDFEPEQMARLRKLQCELRPQREDTPAGLARWLATDMQYWNLVAHQLSPVQLEQASQLLLATTGQQLNVQWRVAEGAAANTRR